MKKTIITTTILLIVLAIGSFYIDGQPKHDTINPGITPFTRLINQNAHMKEKDILNPKIMYPKSPYYYDTISVIPTNEQAKTNDTNDSKTIIKVSNFESLLVKKERAVVVVKEVTTYKEKGNSTEVTMNYYYIFKKYKKKWLIYEQLPVDGSEDPEKLLNRL